MSILSLTKRKKSMTRKKVLEKSQRLECNYLIGVILYFILKGFLEFIKIHFRKNSSKSILKKIKIYIFLNNKILFIKL